MGTSLDQTATGPRRWLHVGGDSDTRRNLRVLLVGAEFDLAEAGDGCTGLRLLYKVQPDVVVLDFHLPDQNGFDLLDRIREVSEVPLTPTEFKMLGPFAENPGRVLGHGQLLDLVWGGRIRAKNEVELYVSYLRRKLGAVGVDPVETVRGVGYRYQPRRTHTVF